MDLDRIDRWRRRQWTPKEIGLAIAGGVVLLLLLIGGFTSYYTVAPEQQAVVLRFGKYHATTAPGLHFKLPFGVDQAIKVPVTEVRTLEFGFRTVRADVRTVYDRQQSSVSLMLTGDLNIANVEWVVQYRVKDAKDWVFNVRAQEKTIRDLCESSMRAVVGDHTVTEVLTEQRERIALQAKELLQESLDRYRIGVHVKTLQLKNVNPPREVQQSFNEVNAAQQEKSRIENDAMREYNKIIFEARGEAKRVKAEAEGYAIDRINRAKGDVARFEALLDAYKAHPEVTRRRLYLEGLETVLPRVERILVVDDEKGLLKLLPLRTEREAK